MKYYFDTAEAERHGKQKIPGYDTSYETGSTWLVYNVYEKLTEDANHVKNQGRGATPKVQHGRNRGLITAVFSGTLNNPSNFEHCIFN